MKRRSQQVNIISRRGWIVYLSSWWSHSTKSLPSSGFLSYPLSHLALWRMIYYNGGSNRSFHKILQWRRSWSHSWNWAWRLVIYRMPLPIQAWRIKFSILKKSIRTVGRGSRQAVFLKRNGKLPLRQKQIPHPELWTKGGPTRRKDGSVILATMSRKEWKRG